MRSVYYVFPPFNSAEIAVGPEAAEINTLPGNFMTPYAYEIRSFDGLDFGWNRKTESYRFVCFTAEAEEKFLGLFNTELAPKGASLVKGRK